MCRAIASENTTVVLSLSGMFKNLHAFTHLNNKKGIKWESIVYLSLNLIILATGKPGKIFIHKWVFYNPDSMMAALQESTLMVILLWVCWKICHCI